MSVAADKMISCILTVNLGIFTKPQQIQMKDQVIQSQTFSLNILLIDFFSALTLKTVIALFFAQKTLAVSNTFHGLTSHAPVV